MRGVLLPVDVVVVHAPDHQRIGERSRDCIHSLAGSDHGRGAATCDFVKHFERNLDVVLLVSAQCTARRVEQEALGLVDRVLR